MKKLYYFFMVVAFILSHLMCIVVAWNGAHNFHDANYSVFGRLKLI